MIYPKTHIIVNPFSGTFKKSDFREKFYKRYPNYTPFVKVFYTEREGHAIELTQKAVQEGVAQVFVLGGDGTLNEVASVLVHTPVVLGVLPGGSGNGFATHIGMTRNVWKALDILLSGKTKQILADTIQVNNQFCLNMCGVGFDARVAYFLRGQKSRGLWLYVRTFIKQLKALRPIDLEVEDESGKRQRSYLLALVANGSMYGYDFVMAPGADVSDNQLDLLLIYKTHWFNYLLALPKVFKRTIHTLPFVEYKTVRWVKIRALKTDFWHLDGEGFRLEPEQELQIRLVPASLRVLVA